jgi:UPF0716 protein FxsA
MFRARWVLAGLLILPVAELAVFLAVAAEIGVLAALSLVLMTSLAGAGVIRGAGRGATARLRTRMGQNPLEAATPGVFTVLAGFLLLVPGFLTDIAGIALLMPAVQRRILARLFASLGKRRPKAGSIVELEPDEWRRVADEDTEKRPEATAVSHSCPSEPAVLATPPEGGSSASRVKEG